MFWSWTSLSPAVLLQQCKVQVPHQLAPESVEVSCSVVLAVVDRQDQELHRVCLMAQATTNENVNLRYNYI